MSNPFEQMSDDERAALALTQRVIASMIREERTEAALERDDNRTPGLPVEDAEGNKVFRPIPIDAIAAPQGMLHALLESARENARMLSGEKDGGSMINAFHTVEDSDAPFGKSAVVSFDDGRPHASISMAVMLIADAWHETARLSWELGNKNDEFINLNLLSEDFANAKMDKLYEFQKIGLEGWAQVLSGRKEEPEKTVPATGPKG